MVLPIRLVELALSDRATTILGGTLVTWNATQAYYVHLEPSSEESVRSQSIHPGVGALDLYIDANSYQIVGVSEQILAMNDSRQSYLHEIIFSSYTLTNNIALPFKITERINHQETRSISIESMSLNAGVSEARFAD
jgi:hypothetical protein